MNHALSPKKITKSVISLSAQCCRQSWLASVIIASSLFPSSAQTLEKPQASTPAGASTYPPPTLPTVSPEAPSSAPIAAPAADQSRYVISPGDVLEVSVFGAPDLSQKSPVDSAGDIYLPLINYVHVGGMHVEDAQGVVERAYLMKDVLKAPHVDIIVVTFSSGVVLMGEVGRPGNYPIVGSGKLFDILAEAGGTTASAGQMVAITHKDSLVPQTVFITSDPTQSLKANVAVEQGDTIIVSKAGVIYVVGEVLAPSGFLMDEKSQYSVMKAVAMAHGVTKFAKTSKARIVRRTSEGEQEIPVPLDKILVSRSPDLPMQPNDILFVPSSRGKQFASKTADVATSLASGVAFYSIYR